MAVLTEIKNAISILGDAEFQEFCDIVLRYYIKKIWIWSYPWLGYEGWDKENDKRQSRYVF